MLVCIGSYWPPGPRWLVLAYTGAYWYMLVRIGSWKARRLYQFLLAYTSLHWLMLAYTGPQWFVLVRIGSRQFISAYLDLYRVGLANIGLCWSMLVCIGSYWPVLAQVSPIGHYELLSVFIGPVSYYWPLRVPIGYCWFTPIPLNLYGFIPVRPDPS